MKANIYFLLLYALIIAGCTPTPYQEGKQLFTEDWKFSLGDIQNANERLFDDSQWRTLDLPHDWSIEFNFTQDAPATPGGGALDGGTGWYRKSFRIPKTAEGKKICIDFDGVYCNSEVWINGTWLGCRPYGYSSFQYDLTPYILYGKDNIIAVKVDNSQQPNSRWYSGSGIYRNVYLEILNPVHVAHWGVFATTPIVTNEEAVIAVEVTVQNQSTLDQEVVVKNTVVDSKGNTVAEVISDLYLIPSAQDTLTQQRISIAQPKLWSDTTPYLYTLETTLLSDGKPFSTTSTQVGIRTFEFSAQEGFILNGNPVKIKGVCLHHDLGCLGASVNRRAIERQLEILKEMGCNGIRTSHNPPAPELLELCDQMGFIVMDEAFDVWRKKKTTFDYSKSFPEWHERDMADLILRDRNHPSIFMWSIGNEVLEQWSHIDTDTLDITQANTILNFASQLNKKDLDSTLHVNALLTQKLSEIVKKLDPTRPVIAGCNEPGPYNHLFRSGALDIIGINYNEYNWLPEVHFNNYPGKPLVLTETTSGLMSRGFYMMPSDSCYIWPISWDIPFDKPIHYCSSYDNCHVPWGTTHELSWQIAKKYDHISGLYIWTGFDYLGEPTPFGWPSRSSYFGIIDLAGFPKDVYYMYQAEWSDKDVLHLFPHWNWSEGEIVDLWVYYNHADKVELFLNGKSLGQKSKQGEELHVSWKVPFESGIVKAVAYLDGKAVRETTIQTTGESASIRLTPDRSIISADGKDLSFVTVEVLDANGLPVPTAANMMNFGISGNGEIVGTDNGSQMGTTSLTSPQRNLFNGKCLVVIRSNKDEGEITLTATSVGLPDGRVTITAKK